MKSGSDNFRTSAIQSVINNLKESNVDILIYEPTLVEDEFNEIKVCHDLNEFKNKCDVILANRVEKDLKDVKNKIYTRDIFERD